MNTRFWTRISVLAAIGLMSASSWAQGPIGAIEGTVTDSSGGVVAGATVTVREADTNQTRTSVTDSAGSFRFAQVPVGAYSVQVTYTGFSTFTQEGIALTIGQTARLTIVLTPAGVAETLGVTAQPPPLDIRQTAATMTIDGERIEELPVQSRDYLHFVLLAPGVVSTPSRGVSSTASALPDSGFSFAGLRPRSNMLTIDGVDNNDRYSGTSRTELSLETVREFQIVNNGWAAENGGASGGAINVVTKSGTNIIHGDAFTFGEFGALNAPPPLEDTLGVKPPLTRFRSGFAIGGPIIKDRTFYYGAVEREQNHGHAASDIDPRPMSTINAQLASASPTFGARLTSGLFPTTLRETEWSTKVNHQITTRNTLMVRVAGTDRSESADAFNTGGLSDVSARGSSATNDTAVTARWTSIVGANITSDVSGQVASRRVNSHTGATQGPGAVIAGVAEFGRPYAGNDTHDGRYAELRDTLGWSRGSHFLKAGFDLTNVRLTGTRTDGMGGLFQFPSLEAFLAGQPDEFRQTFGTPTVEISTNHAGAFIQDHWTPTSRVTVDAGVRFDADTLPAALHVTDRQISPRVGVAWTPADKWLVRGGMGRFADRLVLAAFEPALTLEGQYGFEQVASGTTAAAVWATTKGDTLSQPLPGIAPSIYTVHAGSWQPSSRQMSVGVERQLTSNLTASVNYLWVEGRNLSRTLNVNLPPPTVLTLANAASLGIPDPVPQQIGRAVFGSTRLDPAFDGIFQLQPTAASTYHGLTVMLNRRLADELEWSAAYTWSHAMDTASDFDEQPENPYNLGAESADSRYDQRQRFVASALLDLPIGDEEDRAPGELPGFWTRVFSNIEMAPIFTLESGRPVNPLTGTDLALTGAYPSNARPLGMPRNSLRLPTSAELDLRVLKSFNVKPHGKLDLVAEAFNLLNRVNVTQLNTVYGPLATPLPSYGRAVDAAEARRIQFSIDFEF